MPYVTPPTFVATEILTAEELNILGDDIEYLKGATDGTNFSGVQVQRSASTGQANAAWGTITWTAEAFDVGGYWTSGTNVVIPAGAIPAGATSIAVKIEARTLFASNSVGYRKMRFQLNGSTIGQMSTTAVNGDTTDMSLTDIAVVVATDIITVDLYQSSGGSLAHSDSQVTVYRLGVVA